MFDSIRNKMASFLVKKATKGVASVDPDAMTLDDFAKQLDMMGRMGSLSSVAKHMPGLAKLDPEQLKKGEAELKTFKLILAAMTPEERMDPKILDVARKARIADQAGVKPGDVDSLLQRFEQSKQFVKLFKQKGRL